MMRAHKLLVVALLAGCAGGVARTTGPAPASADPILASLSTRQKVAQLVVPWLAGSYAPFDDSAFQDETRWEDTLHVRRINVSVGSPFHIAAKLHALQPRSRLPLLISADLDGGAAP